MRTRRAFRPVVESLSSRLVLSGNGLTDPLAPILVPSTDPTPSPLPTDPIMVSDPTPYYETYVGPDQSTIADPGLSFSS